MALASKCPTKICASFYSEVVWLFCIHEYAWGYVQLAELLALNLFYASVKIRRK